MAGNENHRETGARKYPAVADGDAAEQFSQDAAGNKPPVGGTGLTRSSEETNDETHQSEGRNPPNGPTPSPSSQKTSGAGPAVAEHSKDAKAPKAGRQPGAYVKD